MGGYIRPISGQRLGKHIAAATGETGCCLRGPRRGVTKKRIGAIKSIVCSHFCAGLEHGSRGMAIVNICYQETSSENTAEEWPLLEAVTRKR
jgi:hypothetical protein